MDRLACIDLPAFPLQRLFRRHPQWREQPAAVIDKDSPQGKLLWVNEAAWRSSVRPGMRYATALSLSRHLGADVVGRTEIEAGIDEVLACLRPSSPRIEPSRSEPGVFWLDLTGLGLLYPDLDRWAQELRTPLTAAGLESTVVVGYRRFATYAVAKALAAAGAHRSPDKAVYVFADPHSESALAARVPLERLAIDPRLRDTLSRLGIRNVGDFVALPADSIGKRFGDTARTLHERASGRTEAPLEVEPEPETLSDSITLDDSIADATSLLFFVRRLLAPLLVRLAERGEAAAELRLVLELEKRLGHHDQPLEERLRPANPTLDESVLLDLAALRLERLRLQRGACALTVETIGVRATVEQLRLFATRPRRDLDAANRALARLRAELGEEAVLRLRLREGHLPEARFVWEPLRKLDRATPRNVRTRTLVRRLLSKPQPLEAPARHGRDRPWSATGLDHGRIERSLGPYVLSGGWWKREIHREYHFVVTERGQWLWVFFDKWRRRWFLHGRVE